MQFIAEIEFGDSGDGGEGLTPGVQKRNEGGRGGQRRLLAGQLRVIFRKQSAADIDQDAGPESKSDGAVEYRQMVVVPDYSGGFTAVILQLEYGFTVREFFAELPAEVGGVDRVPAASKLPFSRKIAAPLELLYV